MSKLIVIALATLALTQNTVSAVADESESTPSVAAAFIDCLDCEYLYRQEEPPQAPGHPYIYYMGAYDCEDGYSPNGPCIPCEDSFCETEGYVASDSETLCEDYPREPSFSERMYKYVSKLLNQGNAAQVEALLAKHTTRMRYEADKNQLEFLDCSAKLVNTITLPRSISSAFENYDVAR